VDGLIRMPLKDRDGVRFWLEIERLADYNVLFTLKSPEGAVVGEHMDLPGEVAHDFMDVLGLRPWDHKP
jgi:hypothetical protein